MRRRLPGQGEARSFYTSTGFAFFLTVAVVVLTNLVGRQLNVGLFPFTLAVGVILGLLVGVAQGVVSLSVCLLALIGFWLRPELLPESSKNAVLLRIPLNIVAIVLAAGVVLYSDRVKGRFRRLLSRARELANIDGLTGISNRRHADELLFREFKRSERLGHMFSVLLLDIDHFKRINDSLGHLMGDAVLKELVGVVRQQLREYDSLARWGGEEFLVILPETPTDQASRVGERIRKAVAGHRFVGEAVVTISMGVASLQPEDDTESLLERADTLLLKAKQQGRNQTLW